MSEEKERVVFFRDRCQCIHCTAKCDVMRDRQQRKEKLRNRPESKQFLNHLLDVYIEGMKAKTISWVKDKINYYGYTTLTQLFLAMLSAKEKCRVLFFFPKEKVIELIPTLQKKREYWLKRLTRYHRGMVGYFIENDARDEGQFNADNSEYVTIVDENGNEIEGWQVKGWIERHCTAEWEIRQKTKDINERYNWLKEQLEEVNSA